MNALQFPNAQIPLFGDETDDQTFIEKVSDVINGMLLDTKVAGISVVKIRDWFGPKWLGFSGKKLGAIGIHKYVLTLPPFHPHRVLSQRFYAYHADSLAYEKVWPPFRLHIKQPSEKNFERRVGKYLPSGALVWYSSDSARTGQGALMIYVTIERFRCGYFGLERADDLPWRARSYYIEQRTIPIEVFESWRHGGRAERLGIDVPKFGSSIVEQMNQL